MGGSLRNRSVGFENLRILLGPVGPRKFSIFKVSFACAREHLHNIFGSYPQAQNRFFAPAARFFSTLLSSITLESAIFTTDYLLYVSTFCDL